LNIISKVSNKKYNLAGKLAVFAAEQQNLYFKLKKLYNAIMSELDDSTSHLKCSIDIASVLLPSGFLN
jgi:hypothetical protein